MKKKSAMRNYLQNKDAKNQNNGIMSTAPRGGGNRNNMDKSLLELAKESS